MSRRFLLLLLAALPLRAPAHAAAPVLSEPATWLQQYLRIDTSNPPGNEGRAAELLAGLLQRAGIPSRVIANPQGRANLYARLASPRSGGGGGLPPPHHGRRPPGARGAVPPLPRPVTNGGGRGGGGR